MENKILSATEFWDLNYDEMDFAHKDESELMAIYGKYCIAFTLQLASEKADLKYPLDGSYDIDKSSILNLVNNEQLKIE